MILTLYHGTTQERALKILREGFRPGTGHFWGRGVCFAYDPETAGQWAWYTAHEESGIPAVLRAEVRVEHSSEVVQITSVFDLQKLGFQLSYPLLGFSDPALQAERFCQERGILFWDVDPQEPADEGLPVWMSVYGGRQFIVLPHAIHRIEPVCLISAKEVGHEKGTVPASPLP